MEDQEKGLIAWLPRRTSLTFGTSKTLGISPKHLGDVPRDVQWHHSSILVKRKIKNKKFIFKSKFTFSFLWSELQTYLILRHLMSFQHVQHPSWCTQSPSQHAWGPGQCPWSSIHSIIPITCLSLSIKVSLFRLVTSTLAPLFQHSPMSFLTPSIITYRLSIAESK
jgi:hypothetical protein